MRTNIRGMILLLSLAVVAALPLSAQWGEISGGGGGGLTEAAAGALFCELTGCTMTGALTMDGPLTGTSVTIDADSNTESAPRLTFTAVGANPGTRYVFNGDARTSTSRRIVGIQNNGTTDLGLALAVLNAGGADVFSVSATGAVQNLGAVHSGRVYIDDDAEVTGTLTVGAGTYSGGTLTSSSTLILDPGNSIVRGGAGSDQLGSNASPWFAVFADTVDTPSVTNAGADLTLSTTTSGDLVLAPVSGVVQQTTTTTSGTRPACADAIVGSLTFYDDGAGARTLCVCEETATDTFAWGAVTASGSC